MNPPTRVAIVTGSSRGIGAAIAAAADLSHLREARAGLRECFKQRASTGSLISRNFLTFLWFDETCSSLGPSLPS